MNITRKQFIKTYDKAKYSGVSFWVNLEADIVFIGERPEFEEALEEYIGVNYSYDPIFAPYIDKEALIECMIDEEHNEYTFEEVLTDCFNTDEDIMGIELI